MTQQAYSNQALGYPGQRMGCGAHEADTFINDSGFTAEVRDVNVDAAADSTAYSVTVEGILITITSGVGATQASIRDQLIEACRAEPAFEGVVAFNPSGTAMRCTALNGANITVTDADANLTTSEVTAYSAAQAVPFGRAVVKRTGAGTTDYSAALPSAAGQLFLGIAERIHSDVDTTDAADEIAPGKTMTVGRRGDYLVEVEEAVAVGDDAYFRHTAGAGGTVIGRFRTDADTATADQVPNGSFRTSTTGAGLAVLRIV